MSFRTDPLDLANTQAARATTAYLLGRGLAVEIDDSRFPDDRDPIPAPGLADLVSELAAATGDACNAGDLVAQLVRGPNDGDRRAFLDAALDDSLDASEAAPRTTRSLAQLALGVRPRGQLLRSSALGIGRRTRSSSHRDCSYRQPSTSFTNSGSPTRKDVTLFPLVSKMIIESLLWDGAYTR